MSAQIETSSSKHTRSSSPNCAPNLPKTNHLGVILFPVTTVHANVVGHLERRATLTVGLERPLTGT